MIAGTIALLEETADEPLESQGTGGFTTLDVRETQTYLDDSVVQRGRAASHVDSKTEEITVSGSHIDVEEIGTSKDVWTEWVADVTSAGFVAAERTAGSVPVFPFDVFEARLGTIVEVATIDPGAFVDEQRRTDDLRDVWFSASKAEADSDLEPDDVAIGYGRDATRAGGNVGVGFRVGWNGTVARGVLYESGYVALYNDSWGPVQFARFVREEILPHASTPQPEEDFVQESIGEEGGEA